MFDFTARVSILLSDLLHLLLKPFDVLLMLLRHSLQRLVLVLEIISAFPLISELLCLAIEVFFD